MAKTPTCIVCGKDCKPDVRHLFFLPATLNGRQNGDRDGSSVYVDLENRPRSKEEVQRYTNDTIRKVTADREGRISMVSTWDGVTYVDPYFHSQTCAAIFGRRMARQGYRM